MITSPEEADFPHKQEGSSSDDKITKASSNSTPWLRLKDPRIVRVSRAFGGKDRHSKVCTIRGLRDRRVRLSVPTAIQLYDLQDRLGLNQPSKVIDWLLNAAKDEIDELPPLRIPPGNIGLNHPQMLTGNEVVGTASHSDEGFKMNSGSIEWVGSSRLPKPNFWSLDALAGAQSEESAREAIDPKENWTKGNEEDKQGGNGGHAAQFPSNNFLPRVNSSSLPAGFMNSSMPYNYHNWDPSSFPPSNSGSHGCMSRTEDAHNISVMSLPSSSSLSIGSQILVCPPGTTQSFFPSHSMASGEIGPRQINHFQLGSNSHNILQNSLTPPVFPISQSIRPFYFGMSTPKLLHSPNNSGSQANDQDQDQFPSK